MRRRSGPAWAVLLVACGGSIGDGAGGGGDAAPDDGDGCAPTAWYADADDDGHGEAGSNPAMACVAPAGRVASSDDCDDADAAIHPGAAEACNATDDDCDPASAPVGLCASCAAILDDAPEATSGTYVLNGSRGDYDAYCEMDAAGGGWTLVAKIDGASTAFLYDDARWEDASVLNPTSLDLDTSTEAKLEAFLEAPLTEVRAVLRDARGTDRALVLDVPDQISFRALMSGSPIATAAGRAAWLALLPGAGIQTNCNLEGFNLTTGGATTARVRIGLVGNQEDDCTSPDSLIGLGGGAFGANACDQLDTAAGASNGGGCNEGGLSVQATGLILVR
jgi:hypothetical protein